MTDTQRDSRCGCPRHRVIANRAERRRLDRIGSTARVMTLHLASCPLAAHAPLPGLRGTIAKATQQPRSNR